MKMKLHCSGFFFLSKSLWCLKCLKRCRECKTLFILLTVAQLGLLVNRQIDPASEHQALILQSVWLKAGRLAENVQVWVCIIRNTDSCRRGGANELRRLKQVHKRPLLYLCWRENDGEMKIETTEERERGMKRGTWKSVQWNIDLYP